MIKLISEKIIRIIKNKKNLEKDLNIKIKNRGAEIYLSGNPEDEYIAEKIIEALDFGFPFATAMLIKKEDFDFITINIKDYSNQKNLERVRGRIIGKNGKALKTLSSLSNCSFEIKDNQIGIIGDPDCIKGAEEACKSILKGSKHANVYSYLEKHQVKPLFDLGLKKLKKEKQ